MKKSAIFVPLFVLLLIINCSVVPSVKMSEDISKKVLRLHILANSDSEYDQSLKLKVRDDILDYSKKLFRDCTSLDEAINIAENNTASICKRAQKTLNNCYNVRVTVTDEYYNTRKYDGFTLPAGVYKSIRIIIGEGRGHNWWCVMFPSVCLSGCTDDLGQTLSEKELEMIEDKNYIIKFKIVEIYEKIKDNIS